jgi:hypothetical protein
MASTQSYKPQNTGFRVKTDPGLVAWLVLNRGWYEWLDIESPEN